MVVARLDQLDQEIEQKQRARELLASMLGESSLTQWHESLEQLAPDAHFEWLMKQGFDEKQAMRLKWLSKDMNQHEQYMHDFMRVFEALERWAPGSEMDTLNALKKVPHSAKQLLEIGCGQGIASRVLLKNSEAHLTAIDNEQTALDNLEKSTDFSHRLTTVCANMNALPFEATSFDLIWSEGSAYIMGVENALKAWRSLLTDSGILVVSDLVWAVDSPEPESQRFWQKEYPDMTTVEVRIKQAQQAGYEVLETFPISDDAWDSYYQPLEQRLTQLEPELVASQAFADLTREVEAYKQRSGQFDYQMFLLRAK
jgi:SAM-dependent methyltransferase